MPAHRTTSCQRKFLSLNRFPTLRPLLPRRISRNPFTTNGLRTLSRTTRGVGLPVFPDARFPISIFWFLVCFQWLAHSLSRRFVLCPLFSAAYRLFLRIQGGGWPARKSPQSNQHLTHSFLGQLSGRQTRLSESWLRRARGQVFDLATSHSPLPLNRQPMIMCLG